jgi:acyl-CoA synthetase (AMP-forming)/AMP-acid ligase II
LDHRQPPPRTRSARNCKERIAHYKVPRYVRFVDDYPMTVTGKVQKFKMREIMTHELGLPAKS